MGGAGWDRRDWLGESAMDSKPTTINADAKPNKGPGLKPRIIRDGVAEEMLLSLAQLEKSILSDEEACKLEKEFLAKLDAAFRTIRELRDKLVPLERSLDLIPPDGRERAKPLRVKARALRDKIYEIYEDAISS